MLLQSLLGVFSPEALEVFFLRVLSRDLGLDFGRYLFPFHAGCAGGADEPLARTGVPTPGGVRGRAAIGDRTRTLPLGCEHGQG